MLSKTFKCSNVKSNQKTLKGSSWHLFFIVGQVVALISALSTAGLFHELTLLLFWFELIEVP